MAGAFSPPVYAARITALQQLLQDAGLDAALLTDEANLIYFTGFAPEHFFLTRSRLVALIVPVAGAPLAIAPTSHLQHLRDDTSQIELHGYEGLLGAPVPRIAAALQEVGARTVGAELSAELRVNMTIADFDSLRAQTRAQFQDASALIWKLRLVKSEAEIALMEQACQIGDMAYAQCLPTVRAGRRESEVAARLASAVDLAGGRTAFLIMASGAGKYHRSNGAPGERVLVTGDFLFIDLGVRVAGYHADFNRCLVVGGGHTPEQRDLQNRVIAVTDAAARYLVPGVPVREVYARVLDDCRRAGLAFEAPGRIGHGIGLGVTEPPHISAEDSSILEAGMVVTIEPAVQREDGLYCAERVYVVEPTGGRALNRASAVLPG